MKMSLLHCNMKLVIFSALVLFSCSNAFVEEYLDEWETFKSTYKRSYKTASDEEERRSIFINNMNFIREHNALYEKGEVTYTVGVNEFADMTNEEFTRKMNRFQHPLKGSVSAETFQTIKRAQDLPSSIDWRDLGAVTPIKNQGACGSCWAFSAIGSLEGQQFLKTNQLISLSEQNLVDCALEGVRTDTNGCDGGYMVTAFEYILRNGGIDTEASYPYQDNYCACQYNSSTVGATMTSYVNITEGSEDDLMAAVATVGPVSVAIDAGHLSFQLYRSGVYKKIFCQRKHLNHGVTVVGYGTKSGFWLWDGDYWLVKNSWGTSWGEKGYVLMARNHSNMCGIATMASYPVI